MCFFLQLLIFIANQTYFKVKIARTYASRPSHNYLTLFFICEFCVLLDEVPRRLHKLIVVFGQQRQVILQSVALLIGSFANIASQLPKHLCLLRVLWHNSILKLKKNVFVTEVKIVFFVALI
jgi:hypothetical protein